jgi:hypothetical protein
VGDQRLGSTEPRLFTPSLRPLTPETSLGFEFCEFAELVIGIELLPWQRWWAIHAFELGEDGRFRFRVALTLVARQNGKTILMRLVALWMMFMGHAREVLGTAQALSLARETWDECIGVIEDVPDLKAELSGTPRRANGQESFQLLNGARYRVSAATRSAARGKSIDLLLPDELREWLTFDAWGALSKTTTARPNSMILPFSNAGDHRSVVLKTLRASALGGRTKTVGLFEWSAPDGCALDDPDARAQANPALGYTITDETLDTALATDPPGVYRTEVLCQEVESLAEGVDVTAWRSMADPKYIISEIEPRPRVVLGLDVSLDGTHVSLVAAAQGPNGLIYVEPIDGWGTTDEARAGLPEWVDRIKPVALAWLPGGPAGVLALDIKALKKNSTSVQPLPLEDLAGNAVKEACQGLADLVASRRIAHPGDPMLDAHITGAQRWDQGDGWRFARRGAAPIDAVYATAAAVHVLRALPPPARSFVY